MEKVKKVRMRLAGLDGNAFSLLGAFTEKAKEQGWTQAEIKAVRDEAMSGDYEHLLETLVDHTTETDEEGEQEMDVCINCGAELTDDDENDLLCEDCRDLL